MIFQERKRNKKISYNKIINAYGFNYKEFLYKHNLKRILSRFSKLDKKIFITINHLDERIKNNDKYVLIK